MFHRMLSLSGAVAVVLMVTGCSFSVSLGDNTETGKDLTVEGVTAPLDEIASLAAISLENVVGLLPEVDCGDGEVGISEGVTVNCLLTAPDTGSKFDTLVTIVDVDGEKYSIEVEVGNDPIVTDE